MYPNTMEFSHTVKKAPSITFSMPKILGLLALIISFLSIAAMNLNAREVRPIQMEAQQTPRVNTVNLGTLNPNDDEMNRLRINLQTNLAKDGIVLLGEEKIKIIFRDDFISVNDRVLCFNHMHKYSAIFNAYGVSAGTHREILLKGELIIIGINEDGEFKVDFIHNN